jgi:muramoyltetrapeptide carboxypeptidase
MAILKPHRLNKGDVIGIVSPASPITDPSRIQDGVRYLESIGYRTLVGRHAEARNGYLAGTDKQRADDLHGMFRNRHVKAIFCVRGGYGTPRLLPMLNYPLVQRNPKILVGFSDITALQLALWRKCRLVTFNGPMVGVDMSPGMEAFTEEHFWRVLTSGEKAITIRLAAETTSVLRKGTAAGRLLGGNLSLLVNLLGTPFMPSLRDSILFVEEVGEDCYRVDRMLTQLRNTGILAEARAVLTGQFTDCLPMKSIPDSQTMEDVLRDVAGRLRVPFVAGLSFGHHPAKLTLPLGVAARVRTRSNTIDLLESVVR